MLTMLTSDVDGTICEAGSAGCGRGCGNGWSFVLDLLHAPRMSETASCCSLDVLL